MIKKAVYLERSPAKINLFLNVLGLRDDGYHDLQTIFQAIELSDHLTLSIAVDCAESQEENTEEIDFEIKIDSNSEEVRTLGLTNTVTKAIEAYFVEVPQQQIVSLLRDVNIDVYIDKKVPLEGGLAGGSGNAAATLRALNKFFAENFDWSLNEQELLRVAASVGSDVPFCLISNKTPRAYAESRGEKFFAKNFNFNFDDFPHLVIIKPNFGVSTASAYDQLSKKKFRSKAFDGLYNSFEDVVYDEHPELLNIQEQLMNFGCNYVLLSGSGSSMIGFIEDSKKASKVFELATEVFPEDYRVFQTKFLPYPQKVEDSEET